MEGCMRACIIRYFPPADRDLPHPPGAMSSTLGAPAVRARPNRFYKSVLYGAFVWARRALKHTKRRFPARAVGGGKKKWKKRPKKQKPPAVRSTASAGGAGASKPDPPTGFDKQLDRCRNTPAEAEPVGPEPLQHTVKFTGLAQTLGQL